MYSHQLAIDKNPSNLLGCNYMCEHSRLGSRELRKRYSGQPANPEHTGGSYELLNLGTASLTMGLDLAGSSGFPSSAQGARDKLYGRFSACSMPRLHTPASDGIRRRTRTIRSTQSLYEYKKNAYFELGPMRISFRKLNCSGV
jgi:hypothetical protein